MNHVANVVRFTLEDAEAASKQWGFNCGPAALCAVLDLTPIEVLPVLVDFHRYGYVNPTMMFDALRRLNASHSQVYRSDVPSAMPVVRNGLVRVQWSGPWVLPGVPWRARYCHTHWIAVRGEEVFDINAICIGGWISMEEWAEKLVPWLLKEGVRFSDGKWWPTHVVEVAEHA